MQIVKIEDVLSMIQKEIEGINPIPSKYLKSKGNDNGFEELFPMVAQKIAEQLLPNNTLGVNPQLGHHFPDVDLILNDVKYGVELKSRNNGTWYTNGNSVLESITDDDYEEIYLFFGSKIPNEQRLSIRFAPYWQTTKSIKVTHSPRFIIDISNIQTSVFENKEQYDHLRKLDEPAKISFLQNYLKNNTDGTKWFVSQDNNEPPLYFSDLNEEKKERLIAELFLLFPSDLLGRKTNVYRRSAIHLITVHYVFSNALRDNFSASGTFKYNNVDLPHVYLRLKHLAPVIKNLINQASEDFKELLYSTWEQDHLIISKSENTFEDYKNVIDSVINQSKDSNLLEDFEKANISTLSGFIF